MAQRRAEYWANADCLRKLMTSLNLTAGRAAAEIGFSDSILSTWLKENKMPLSASLACECIIRRQGNSLQEQMFMIRSTDTKALEAIETMAKHLGVKLTKL